MKTFNLNSGAVVEYFDDLREIPIYKLNSFQMALIQAAGMGSTILDIDERFAKLDAFLSAGKVNEAIRERENMRFGLFFLLENINTESLSLAHLVYSIDGQPVKDATEEHILATARRLESGGVSLAQVGDVIESVKKKLTTT